MRRRCFGKLNSALCFSCTERPTKEPLPRSTKNKSEKLPLGFAPPTMMICPFPPSGSRGGRYRALWPTRAQGPSPSGARVYLEERNQLGEGPDGATRIKSAGGSPWPLQLPRSPPPPISAPLLWVAKKTSCSRVGWGRERLVMFLFH